MRSRDRSGAIPRASTFTLLALAMSRMPAPPLRASGSRVLGRLVVILVAVALLSPPGLVGPSPAQAQEPTPTPSPISEPRVDDRPIWKALHPDPISDGSVPEVSSASLPVTDTRWTTNNLKGVHFPTDDVGYAVGANGTVLRTVDGGDNWKVQHLSWIEGGGTIRPLLNDVHVVVVGVDAETGERTDVVVAVGCTSFVGVDGTTNCSGGSLVIVRSVDGGQSWRRIDVRGANGSTLPSPLTAVDFPPAPGVAVERRIGYAVGLGTILKTGDGGRSWTDQPAGPLKAVQFVTPDRGATVEYSNAINSTTTKYLRTTTGGTSWSQTTPTPSFPLAPKGIALLETNTGAAVGYAVGIGDGNGPAGGAKNTNAQTSVVRTTNGFETVGAPETAANMLNGVVANFPPDPDPSTPGNEAAVADNEVVHAVGSQLVKNSNAPFGPPIGVVLTRDNLFQSWSVEPIEDWARNAQQLQAVSSSPSGETVVAVGSRGIILRRSTNSAELADPTSICLPGALEPLTHPTASAMAALRKVLVETPPEAREALGGALGVAAATVRNQKPNAGSTAGSVLETLATNLDDLARTVRDQTVQDPDGKSVEDHLEELQVTIEGGPHAAAEALRGATGDIDSQGSSGNEDADAQVDALVAALTQLADTVENDAWIGLAGTPVCPDPVATEETAGPPAIEPDIASLTPNSGGPESDFKVTGNDWLVCDRTACDGVEVELSFVQEGRAPVPLGSDVSKTTGRFEKTVAVPKDATPGAPAVVRVTGLVRDVDESEVRPATAEMPFIVELPPWLANHQEPPAPSIDVEDEVVAARDFPVVGKGWLRCSPCAGSSVRLSLHQRDRTFDLGTVLANSWGEFRTRVKVPDDAVPGVDTVVRAEAIGEPSPQGSSKAEKIVVLLTACAIQQASENTKDFPCLKSFQFEDEDGKAVATPMIVGFDPGLGAGDEPDGRPHGRVVASNGSDVFLYDVERLEQRGVPGFGRLANDQANEDAEARGVAPGGGSVLDTKRHILFGALGRSISAVSLTGGFPSKTVDFSSSQLPVGITHLTADGSNSMVYAAGTNGIGGADQIFATTAPQHDVFVYAFRAQVAEGNITLELSWSLYVGDLCVTTAHKRSLKFFGVSSDGRRLSLPCQGTDFLFTGTPQAAPNGILNLVLPEAIKPSELTDSSSIVRRFEIVPGGGMGIHGSQLAAGDPAARVVTWRLPGRVLFWDVDRAMWIGSMTDGGDLLAADPASRRIYLNSSLGRLNMFQVANLPGNTQRADPPKGCDPKTPQFCAVPTGLDEIAEGNVQGAFDPRTRRLLVPAKIGSQQVVAVLEDRIDPPIAFADPDPDSRTKDIDEKLAYSVDRRAATAAFGARVWSTGLQGSLPGSYLLDDDQFGTNPTGCPGPFDICPPAGGTYDWLYSDKVLSNNVPFGGLSALPWKPHGTQRELYTARVEEASLAVQDSSLSEVSSGLSDASARGLDIDDGTGGDLRARRGVDEWRAGADAKVVQPFCDDTFAFSQMKDGCKDMWDPNPATKDDGGRGQWDKYYNGTDAERFDECILELSDRLFREVDGTRQVEPVEKDKDGNPTDKPNPCFGPGDPRGPGGGPKSFKGPDLDQNDPDWTNDDDGDGKSDEDPVDGKDDDADGKVDEDPKGGKNTRDGLEQRLGHTQASSCYVNTPEANKASTGGSRVVCDFGGTEDDPTLGKVKKTLADAEGSVFQELPGTGGATLRIEGSFADTRNYRDKRGIVSEARAFSSGVELKVPGKGGLRIGLVGTLAQAWANGHPGGAGSSYEVGYSDVTVTGPDGQTTLSCDPRQETVKDTREGAEKQVPDQAGQARDGAEKETEKAKQGAEKETEKAKQGAEKEVPSLSEQAKPVEDAKGQADDADAEASVESNEPKGCSPGEITDVLSRVLPQVELVAANRDSDPSMLGSAGGAQAIVRRDRRDFYNDWVLFDNKRDELPGLTLSFKNDGTQFNRYQIDLAGVFAESTYYIGELAPKLVELPAEIEVSLSDTDGVALAGGGFEVVSDAEGNGVLDGFDKAVARCTTGTDGIGDCKLSSVEPGSYIVRELSAPPGYLAEPTAVKVDARAGSTKTVSFVNARDAGTVEVSLVDSAGAPIEGGTFDLTHDKGASTPCSTDKAGQCSLWPVPLGDYTLTQKAAPNGYEPAEPVNFALTAPGQTARIKVMNARSGTGVTAEQPGTLGQPGTPGRPGTKGSEATEVIIIEGSDLVKAVVDANEGGGWWERVGRGLAQAISRNPWQALAFALLALMLLAPGYLASRRRELSMMRQLT